MIDHGPTDGAERLAFLREEVRFEIGLLHERTWRPEPKGRRGRDLDQRLSMLFARAVPAVLVVAWSILLVVALTRLATP